jgi:hypothetical protein
MKHFLRRMCPLLILALAMACGPGVARAEDCPVGVNVNSLQNFNATEQQEIVGQLKRSGVHFVRTSLRPDDKNMNLAKLLQSEAIRLVLVPGVQFSADAPLRQADPRRHMRSAMPLSYADPERSRASFQTLFDKLDENGVVVAGVELGNEINWTDFNGDFPIPGQGRVFTLADLSRDPEAKRVAEGFLQYLKVLAVLREVRDHSRLNRQAPIISAGLATVGGSWQHKLQVDSVSIAATLAFLRAHGLDTIADGYGVHVYPPAPRPGDKTSAAESSAQLDSVFPAGNAKPYWLTEWGFTSVATSSAQDQARSYAVAATRAHLVQLFRQGRLGGMFWYVWNEPDEHAIYRGGTLMQAGQLAIAPMPAR